MKNLLYKILRRIKYCYQRWTRGFDDRELWNLDDTIAQFVLPRLRAFRDYTSSHPGEMTFEQYKEKIDEMIFAMEFTILEGDGLMIGAKDFDTKYKRYRHGMRLFAKYFRDLWD